MSVARRVRPNYYKDLTADYSRPGLVSKQLGDQLIEKALHFIQLINQKELPEFTYPRDRLAIERENKEWWPTHCEALRRGRGDILAAEYRDSPELVYFCQDGPFYGKKVAGSDIESSWWKLLAQPGVTMCWPIVMFHGEVVYFEWKCVDDSTNETTAKGSVTFLRRGHAGACYLKTEQLTFYRDVRADFFQS